MSVNTVEENTETSVVDSEENPVKENSNESLLLKTESKQHKKRFKCFRKFFSRILCRSEKQRSDFQQPYQQTYTYLQHFLTTSMI